MLEAAWSLVGALTTLLAVAIAVIGILLSQRKPKGNTNPHDGAAFMGEMSVQYQKGMIREIVLAVTREVLGVEAGQTLLGELRKERDA